MFQSFIYLRKRLSSFIFLSKRLSDFIVTLSNRFLKVSFFLSQLVFLTSVCQAVMISVLLLRYFDCSLELVFFSLLLLQPFNFSPVSFACNFQD